MAEPHVGVHDHGPPVVAVRDPRLRRPACAGHGTPRPDDERSRPPGCRGAGRSNRDRGRRVERHRRGRSSQFVELVRQDDRRPTSPPDWIDRATGRESTLFVGQGIGNSNAFWSIEFWNQSIHDVWTVDGSSPGLGQTWTPNFGRVDGEVSGPRISDRWGVAPASITLAGKPKELRRRPAAVRARPADPHHELHVERRVRRVDGRSQLVRGVREAVCPSRNRARDGVSPRLLRRHRSRPADHPPLTLANRQQRPARAGAATRAQAPRRQVESLRTRRRRVSGSSAVPDRRRRDRFLPTGRRTNAERPDRLRVQARPLAPEQTLGVLPHEAEDPPPVPERAPRQPALVGLGLVLVPHDGRRDVPPLPTRLHRAVRRSMSSP